MLGWNDSRNPSPGWRISAQLPSRRRHYWILFFVVLVVLFVLTHPAHVTTKAEPNPGPEPEPTPGPPSSNSTQEEPPQNVTHVVVNLKTHWEYPPSWDTLKQWERDLPQHDLDLPFPEGRTGRYLKFSNQVQGLGWNNVFNELLMNAHLAYESRRAYVFRPYIWKDTHYSWPRERMREFPPATPLNAIISGPTVGGSWDEGDDAPRSVSETWFDIVCPVSERRIINTGEVKPVIGWADGIDVFNYWKKILLEAPERCVEVQPEDRGKDFFPQTFDLWLWGSARILSLWDSFSNSPTSRLLAPSPIVRAAVERNEYLFVPRGPRPDHPVPRNPYDRMLAIHVRRGDFKESCLGLAKWNSTFYSWNLLPRLPDVFTPPPGGEEGNNTAENVEIYLQHCLPTFDSIVHKVRDSRKEFLTKTKMETDLKALDIVFLLTNEVGEWLEKLKDTLREDGWHTVVTSRDLVLDQEQTEVNMAVDMEIARRAAVFVGNGWSSFTSNIIHKRLVDKREPLTCRFY